MQRQLSITTRVGDRGTTRTLCGATLAKNHLRIDTCGQVDELMSALGLARAAARDRVLKKDLLALQRPLFQLSAEISAGIRLARQLGNRMDAAAVQTLETCRLRLEQSLKPMRGFVIPGENLLGAHLDFARTVARRCERAVVALTVRGQFRNSAALIWLNRLSDVLWLMARRAEGATRLRRGTRS